MKAIPIVSSYRPHVQDLLMRAGLETSAGGSARGWSALQLPGRCWRLAYYILVKGLRPKRPSDAMDVGTAYHACMELHYKTGGRDTFKPLESVLDAEVPDIAWTVRRCIAARMAKFAQIEADTWDVRAIEHEVVNHIEGVPSFGRYGGKRIKAPISSKFDLVIAKREPGGQPHPAGPVPAGVWLFDHKTMGRLTRDKTSGFGMDPQLLLMALNWRLAKLDKVLGPLLGIIIELIVTTKEVGVERMEITLSDEDVDRFRDSLEAWAVELESMLAAEDRDEIELWPMNFAGCRSAYGLCRYFDLCESHGRFDSEYERVPGFVPARGLVKQDVKPPRPRAARRRRRTTPAESPEPAREEQ